MAPCLQRPDGTAGGVGELCDGLNNGQEKTRLETLAHGSSYSSDAHGMHRACMLVRVPS